MSVRLITPTGIERHFGDEEIIVSKTDLSGGLTYVNALFLQLSDYTEDEVLGQPHNMIRHPDMPRAVFEMLWRTIASGKEIFAYVINMAKNGDHYWVLAHVTPTFGSDGKIIGYHSNRRQAERSALDKVRPLYATLLREERKAEAKREQVELSSRLLNEHLAKLTMSYDEFVWSLAA